MSFGSGFTVGHEQRKNEGSSTRNNLSSNTSNTGLSGVIRMPDGFRSIAVPSIHEVPEESKFSSIEDVNRLALPSNRSLSSPPEKERFEEIKERADSNSKTMSSLYFQNNNEGGSVSQHSCYSNSRSKTSS